MRGAAACAAAPSISQLELCSAAVAVADHTHCIFRAAVVSLHLYAISWVCVGIFIPPFHVIGYSLIEGRQGMIGAIILGHRALSICRTLGLASFEAVSGCGHRHLH